MSWHVRLEEADGPIERLLDEDRALGAYLDADLCPPMRAHTRFWIAARQRDEALIALYQAGGLTVVCSLGAAEGVAAALDAVALPDDTALVVPVDHRAVFDARFEVERWDPMLRMVTTQPPAAPDDVQPLGMPDLPGLQALLARRTGFAPFTPGMLAHGVYFGVRRAGELVAVAGTHVVALPRRVAAVGNVYTAPEARRQGHARRATAAVVAELFARGCERVVLNVSAENTAAIDLYVALGFARGCAFLECEHAKYACQAGASLRARD